MYELKIKDLEGVWHTADFGNDKPPMSYQANNIAELENRQANYSLRIKLPFSDKNCQIFGYSNDPTVVTDFPYDTHECRLFSNGFALAGRGALLKLLRVSDGFECQILSGIADFFTMLKNRQMSSIDLGYAIRQDSADLRGGNDIYRTPIATFWRDGDRQFSNTGGVVLPVVYVEKVMNEICEQNRFELIHNLDGKWNDYTTNICDLVASTGALAEREMSDFRGFLSSDIKIDDSNSLSFSGSANRYLNYSSRFDGDITLDLSGRVIRRAAGNTGYNLCITIDRQINGAFNERIVEYVVLVEKDVPHDFNIARSVNLSTNHTLNISVDILPSEPTTIDGAFDMAFSFRYFNSPDVATPIGGRLRLARSLGFEMQFDYFKAIVQALGLTVQVDNANKRVYAFTMEKVYDNKQYALDWTDKLHTKNTSFEFTLGDYAQSNYLRMVENEADEVRDSGLFLIKNKTLQQWKDLFTLPFESGREYASNVIGLEMVFDMANIPLFSRDEENKITFSAGKPHLLKKVGQEWLGDNFYLANHVPAQELIDVFYPRLVDMLDAAKVFEVYLNLNDEDIDRYNQVHAEANCPYAFIPVYLQQFGRYFYINKIQNYVSGRLTKCELVKL